MVVYVNTDDLAMTTEYDRSTWCPFRMNLIYHRTKMLIVFVLLCLLFDYPICECLKDVTIDVPVAVTPGDMVKMRCLYDLEGESLYTVKWYKGRQEFYRYVPKELPHTRVFPLPGVNVDVSQSGSNEVVLRDVQKDLAGKYRCEVSADAPSFHTQVVSSHMHVVYAPDGVPNLMLEKSQYSIGDTLKGNCTSPPSVPSANITWYINGKQMNATFVNRTKLTQKELDVNVTDSFPELWVTRAGLQFEVNTFQVRQLRILCIADLFQVFSSRTEIVLTEERPKLASILYTRGSASYGAIRSNRGYYQNALIMAIICWKVALFS